MNANHSTAYNRFLTSYVCKSLLLLATILFSADFTSAATGTKIAILPVHIENDIGIQNANRIVTGWLMDSIAQAAPDTLVIDGNRAAELARVAPIYRADDVSSSVAWSLRKSINCTHLLEGEIFRWEQKYGIVLKLVDLARLDHVRIERGWADSASEIPAEIENLARSFFSPPSKKGPARKPAAAPERKAPASVQNDLPPVAAALLKKHPEMVYVPGGKFLMGNDNDADADNMPVEPSRREGISRYILLAAEKPEHMVSVKSFLIDKYEVTNAEFKRFRPGYNFPPEISDHPVTGISFYDAKAYAEWAGKRLPTEEEWEKAARGTDGRKWPWGNVFERNRSNLGNGTAPVGGFKGDESPYGAYDMAGNVQEWTSSSFVAYPGNASQDVDFDPKKKVVRGSYYGGNDFLARCSMRFCALPGNPGTTPQGRNYAYIGFRCAIDIE